MRDISLPTFAKIENGIRILVVKSCHVVLFLLMITDKGKCLCFYPCVMFFSEVVFFFSGLGTPIHFNFILDKNLWIVRVGSISLETITQTLRRLPSTTFLVLVSYLYFFAFNWVGIVKGGNLNVNMNGPPVSDFVLFSYCRFFFFFHFRVIFYPIYVFSSFFFLSSAKVSAQ